MILCDSAALKPGPWQRKRTWRSPARRRRSGSGTLGAAAVETTRLLWAVLQSGLLNSAWDIRTVLCNSHSEEKHYVLGQINATRLRELRFFTVRHAPSRGRIFPDPWLQPFSSAAPWYPLFKLGSNAANTPWSCLLELCTLPCECGSANALVLVVGTEFQQTSSGGRVCIASRHLT